MNGDMWWSTNMGEPFHPPKKKKKIKKVEKNLLDDDLFVMDDKPLKETNER